MNGMRKDNLKKAIKYLLILIGIAFACWILFDDSPEKVDEEPVLTEAEEEVASYWEAKYKIPNGTMHAVGSTAFSEIGYDEKNHALIVRFKSSGKAYVYIDVPKTEWDALNSARSIGSYFNRNIKSKYKSYAIAGQ